MASFPSLRRVTSIALLATPLFACGGAAPVAPPPAVPAPPPPPPPPDVTEVAEPDNLVFFGRASNLAASMNVVTDWARLPTLDAGTVVAGFIEGLTETKGFAPLAAIVDPTKPIDFAGSFVMKLPPEGYGAFSAAIKNLDAAKASLGSSFTLTPGEGGIVLLGIEEPKNESKKSDRDASACELAPAAGVAPYRLVCATSREGLAALGPFLTRTTPRRALASDVHVELRAKPIGGLAALGRAQGSAMLAGILGLDQATTPATLDLVSSAVGDVFDYVADLDTMVVDATLDAARATLHFRTSFRTQNSFFAELATAHPDRVDVPPDVFWRLPGDVDFAAFFAPTDESLLAHPRELVTAALAEQMKKKVPAGDARALTDFVKEILRGTRGMVAHGGADASYVLIERDDPPAMVEKVVRDAASVWARPGIVAWMKAGSKEPLSLPTLRIAGPLPGLAPGSLHAILTIPGDVLSASGPVAGQPATQKRAPGKPAKPPAGGLAATTRGAPSVVQVAVVPDGTRSWIVISRDDRAIRSAAAVVTAKTAGPDSLGAQASGLDVFKETRMNSGGFLTMRGLIAAARQLGAAAGTSTSGWDTVLKSLPAHGRSPLVFSSRPSSPTADAPGGVHEVHLDIPEGAVRDAIWLGMSADTILKK